MTEKKKLNPFIKIIIFLFFIFLIVFCVDASGYYESKMHKKTVYTSEKILEFEQDVKNGKEIDLKKYIEEDNTDYSNSFTKISDDIGTYASKIMSEGILETIKVLKALFG